MVNWVGKTFNYISNDTQMVSRSFTTTDSLMVRILSHPSTKTMENASKYLQNDQEEDELFVYVTLLFLWVV